MLIVRDSKAQGWRVVSVPETGFFFFFFKLYSKESACNTVDPGSIPGPGRPPGGGQLTPVFFPGESHEQRSLVGYTVMGPQRETTE